MKSMIFTAKGGGPLKEITGLSSKAPLLEFDLNSVLEQQSSFTICTEELGTINLMDQLNSIYQKWGKFGPYGDILSLSEIKISDSKTQYIVNFIARLAFHKPSLTVDLVPFIVDKNRKVFFFGIIRDDDPGKGKPAFIGGHRDVKGYHFETPLEALCHESNEEASLKIVPLSPFGDSDKEINISASGNIFHHGREILVRILLGGNNYFTNLKFLGEYNTFEDEKLSNLGVKRVNQTTAIYCRIDIDQELDEETIAGWLKAGDDAKEIFVCKANCADNIPDFGISHHKIIYREAVAQELFGKKFTP